MANNYSMNSPWFSDDIRELAKALNKCREEFPPTGKSGKGNRGSYATINDVYDAILPVLGRNDICVLQNHYNETETLETTLLHIPSGQWQRDSRPIIPEAPTQQMRGAAQTYHRRYAVVLMCGICPEEDDDGEAGKKAYESINTAPISPEDYSALMLEINKCSNANQLGTNIKGFNKVESLKELNQTQYRDALKYIKKNGKYNGL